MPIERNKIGKSRPKQHTSPLRDLLDLSPIEALLLEACARKSLDDVKAIFLSDTTLNPDTIRDIYLRTPLHIACSRKDDSKEAAEIVRLLIKQGADVNNGVGDIDGLKPMHIAVLNGNYHCIIVLLEEAKLKLDNLKQLPSSMDNTYDHLSERDTKEYQDLLSITQVLIEHLANKHLTTSTIQSKIPSSSYYGLSEHLFSKAGNDDHLNDTISSITDQLSNLGVDDTSNQIRDDLDGLIAKIRELGVQEKK
ncbi:hypothetical protein BJ944DRAFT_170123 [Cunninghamella echinulata]|nr:hypothetical protein BJ944DRAFT_170123 [Cunninghamella echinulata]